MEFLEESLGLASFEDELLLVFGKSFFNRPRIPFFWERWARFAERDLVSTMSASCMDASSSFFSSSAEERAEKRRTLGDEPRRVWPVEEALLLLRVLPLLLLLLPIKRLFQLDLEPDGAGGAGPEGAPIVELSFRLVEGLLHSIS